MDLNQFKVEKLSQHLYRIVDALDVACYLVVGEKAACLLDTCTGVGNIRACVESITQLPLTVVLSHAHMDHCGGAGWFDYVWMCHSELPILQIHGDLSYRCSFFSSHLGLDLREEDFLPVPRETYLDIQEDMVLDLGGVTVELIQSPGHTPGMICPLICEDRALIIGDACDDNVLLFDKFSSTVGEYQTQLQKLKDRSEQYAHIYGNHGVFAFPAALIDNVLACCQSILDHTDAHIPVQMLGAQMYSSCPIGADTLRLDGKPGNVLYSEEKVIREK
ncbi:MAG: MBL fold metallo-hydrolase [Oscillospiraceae bacterium]|nr:MBL fold metallo-hydrolase [Oscillospiraceae bacterium]